MGTRISEFTSATALTGTELLPIVQQGNTVKTTMSAVKTFSQGVTSITAGAGLSGGTITSTGTLSVQLGVANGVCPLDGSAKIDGAYIPSYGTY